MTATPLPAELLDDDLLARARALRHEQPAAAAAVEAHADALVRDGVPAEAALRRSLEAVGR